MEHTDTFQKMAQKTGKDMRQRFENDMNIHQTFRDISLDIKEKKRRQKEREKEAKKKKQIQNAKRTLDRKKKMMKKQENSAGGMGRT